MPLICKECFEVVMKDSGVGFCRKCNAKGSMLRISDEEAKQTLFQLIMGDVFRTKYAAMPQRRAAQLFQFAKMCFDEYLKKIEKGA